MQIGFDIERNGDDLVTVYLPGSPDPWAGKVVILPAQRVDRVDIEFGDAVTVCAQLGRNAGIFLGRVNKEPTANER